LSHPVVQWQMVTKDPEGAASFYRKLFGWEIAANNALGYRQVSTGEGGTPGGIWPSPPEGHNFVQLFVAVEDLDRSVRDATDLGATVVVPPTTLPDGDAMAVLADPTGIPFGLVRQQPPQK